MMTTSSTPVSFAIRDERCAPATVMIHDHSGRDARFAHSTIGRVRSRRMIGSTTVLYNCVLPAGDRVLVPAGYVSEIADPVIADTGHMGDVISFPTAERAQ